MTIGKAGAEQGTGQRFTLRHAHATIVDEGAITLARGEQLVAQRIVDHGMQQVAVVDKTDRNAEVRKTVQVVVRAVERIDDPDLVLRLAAGAGFLAEDTVVGIGALEFAHDLGLGHAVDFRGEIHARFFLDLKAIYAVHVAQDDGACSACSAHRDVDGGTSHDGTPVSVAGKERRPGWPAGREG